ncbi:hypothetical protein [Arenimonas fontis]|uniref:Cytochrome c domain-containing protein n=1 Tax=Arenimonas fontis TaxID=2608255 RepID=A0A5B2ZAS9_9GAMM|nr:hypothetical protein [Arenimonas fontis]KAA2285067.1 hypothetical protein F0415_07435 [Arenimonas fontis]
MSRHRFRLIARRPAPRRAIAAVLAALAVVASAPSAISAASAPAGAAAIPPLPPRLGLTGLFEDGNPARVDPGHLAFSPQYPLWTDGARKQRWISLPTGTAVDARDPNAWQFPPGTRLWKTFAYDRPVETRMIERLADGSWRYATYIWREDGSDADLAPARATVLTIAAAPEGRYVVPSRDDCTACHEGGATPVLGFSALQLSPDRDPHAPHASAGQLGLDDLVRMGRITGLPDAMLRKPPRIPAASPEERAALGYLHGNCGHCHNRSGRGVPVALNLAALWRDDGIDADSIRASMFGREARYAGIGQPRRLVVPGEPVSSLLPVRMRSRDPLLQMPPLGTQSVDDRGLALVEHWIATMPSSQRTSPKETSP